ncbi:MAG: zeta toxin family protein [Clostridia bacterium]|nr:zeta toxin family protein [Clostridia bacterium]
MKEIMKDFKPLPYDQSIKILEHASTFDAPNTKNMYIVIGANGAGKSTLIANMYKKYDINFPYINADLVKKNQPTLSDAKVMFDTMDIVAESIKTGKSFVYESVFSHPSKLDFLKTAKDYGYKVHVFFVFTDNPEINIKRVAKRVREGGHDVHRDKIINRYYRNLALAKKTIEYCDNFYYLDNSKDLELIPEKTF